VPIVARLIRAGSAAQAELAGAIEIGDDPPPARPLVLERIGF
jgi:hypothetical protein